MRQAETVSRIVGSILSFGFEVNFIDGFVVPGGGNVSDRDKDRPMVNIIQ